ncbi:PTS system fructose-specific transporter subunit IIB [Streptococcus dysgalactiae subsp. equisimilis]|uniref:PTS system fructose-specific transporter subunit IIB n=1 Tax=Streptococcus dysgalactiae subsp. equisimilis TaxID=119602 RepID=A0A9X8SYT0_STREQ|nr:PTS system fructose-specific transporter subunit IIB [Streptococcus dysgalactiae subsp. equisimilis]VEF04642.1 PTS system fructose-specific transporter subunit IIB [Streptococcus dysgalactiae subsp. equisimilis]
MLKLVAVTACPSGVAHTYLAAESLEVAAKKLGINIFVETQGSIGIENALTDEAIQEADAVILTNAIAIKNEDRFKGKPVLRVSPADCIKKAEVICKKLQTKLSK